MTQMNLFTSRNRFRDIGNRLVFIYRGSRTWGRAGVGDWGQQMPAIIYRMDKNRTQLYSTGNCIQHPMINHNGKEFIYLFVCLFVILAPHPRHLEVPRPGVESELQPPAHATAIVTRDPSRLCDLYHSSWQCWILNPPSEARARIHILMDPSQVR